MASGPSHPNEQLSLRKRGTKIVDGTENSTDDVAPDKQTKRAPAAHASGPIGRRQQAAITISGDLVDSSPVPSEAATKPRGKNGAESEFQLAPARLRFNVSLQAKLSKDSDFSVCVVSSDKNRGQVVIESIHVGVYRKGESLFDGDVPLGKEGKVNPGTRKVLPFSEGQNKQLSRVLKSKTFASVSVAYTAPAQTEVTFSIGNEDSKKKKSN